MTKRKKFVISSAILSIGFLTIQFIPNQFRVVSIFALGVISIILFVWSLWESLGLNASLITLILPFFYTLSVGFFWFLLPSNLITRIPVVILFTIGIYALFLTSNIYTVSTIRTIALLRAARGVGFVLTLLTMFLVYDTILSLKESILVSSSLIAILSLPLYIHGFWSIKLEKKIDIKTVLMSLLSALIMGEIALTLYFWPVTVVVGSLFFTVIGYVVLGLGQAKLEGRLFNQTIRDYLTLGLLVLIGMFIATRWR